MSLIINYTTMQREVGRRMGWSRTWYENPTEDQLADFADILDNAMRRFYWPLPSPDGMRHLWSFLAPQTTIQTTSGQIACRLPGDFSDMATPGFTYQAAGGQLNVTRMSDQALLSLLAKSPRSGPPQYYAIQSQNTKTTLTGLSSPRGLAFDSSGNLYVANNSGNTVSVFAPGATSPSSTLSGLTAPTFLTFDANQNLFVVESTQNVVKEFSPGATSPTFTYTGLSSPQQVAFDQDGNIYVSNFGTTTVSRFGHNISTAASTLSGLSAPYGLVFDSSQNLYVSNDSGTSTVSQFQAYTYQTSTTPSATLSGLAAPTNMAFDSSGNLYVANVSSNYIAVFNPGATAPTYKITGTPTGPLLLDQFNNLYSLNTNNGTVSVFAPGATSPSSVIGALGSPQQMAFDSFGNLYVTNSAGNSVYIFAPGANGTYGTGQTYYRSIFYPTPDSSYLLNYRYGITPASLGQSNPYPLGGAVHSETILEACLAETDKMVGEENGPHEQRFRDLLAASILYDKGLTQPADTEPWPFEHEAQDLRVDLSYLRRVVGDMLGYGAHSGAWNRVQFQKVKLSIERGLRRFYWPTSAISEGADGKPVATVPPGYIWSFLMSNANIGLTAGTAAYELPTDFTAIMSAGFIYQNSNNPRLSEISWEAMASLQSIAPRTGGPEYFCIRAKNAPAGQNARYEVIYYPTPDKTYTLLYQYGFMPSPLTDNDPYPLGGSQHSETIMEACLAEAESGSGTVGGPHELKFRALLTASITLDSTLAKSPEVKVWPYENAATTLAVNKAYLKRLIGEALGFGPSPAIWDRTQSQQVKLALETGLRMFYHPPVLPGEKYGWQWSFLRPTSSFTTVSGQWLYDLPPDFAMLHEELIYYPNVNVMYPPIKIVSEREVMLRLQQFTAASRARIAAYRVKGPLDESVGTRYELLLWPVPDDAYEISFLYRIDPSSLHDDTSLPYGGQPNMQTVIEACLAAAEQIAGAPGPRSALFATYLQSSVSQDRMVNSPDSLGINHDRSDRWHCGGAAYGAWGWRLYEDNIVSYNGFDW